MTNFFDAKVRFVPSGSVPRQETVLSQRLRATHRFETAQKTPSGSLSTSVCSLLGDLLGFPRGWLLLFQDHFAIQGSSLRKAKAAEQQSRSVLLHKRNRDIGCCPENQAGTLPSLNF